VVAAAPPADIRYMDETVATFSSLAESSSGKVLYAKGPDGIIPLIRSVLVPPGDRQLDLVFVIDATESMNDDIAKLRELIEPVLSEILPTYPSWRIALVLYKDYFEDFLVKQACPFTNDLAVFRKALGEFQGAGGARHPGSGLRGSRRSPCLSLESRLRPQDHPYR